MLNPKFQIFQICIPSISMFARKIFGHISFNFQTRPFVCCVIYTSTWLLVRKSECLNKGVIGQKQIIYTMLSHESWFFFLQSSHESWFERRGSCHRTPQSRVPSNTILGRLLLLYMAVRYRHWTALLLHVGKWLKLSKELLLIEKNSSGQLKWTGGSGRVELSLIRQEKDPP